ncbi:MAG: peptidylprolyl isomerase [Saprospiraceae bacterium]|nr:peptidylprolyl isomerase [Saprospiraceae bacterium]
MRSILALLLVFPFFLFSQDDPVLFTVEDDSVHLSEFEYIYNKNNGEKADYSRESLEEYLELYIKFKLKVQRAKELQLDTIPSLQKELEGYRRQLANSYLTDKEVSERLARELYDRMQEDIAVSHILISVPKNASKEEEEKALSKIRSIKNYIEQGSDFEEMAKAHSDDKNTKNKGGYIGYVTAMLPNGFYELENAIYTLDEGEISDPVRTPVGYHLVRVEGSRPARGKIEAAHILIRKEKKGQPDPEALARIDSIYQMLEDGKNFEDLARRFSEDKSSKNKGGNIGIFGINRYERSFEDAAFGLEEEGSYTKPVETSIGWHIIKLVDRIEMGSYERIKRRLQADITKDDRYEIAQKSMIDRIKSENDFKVNDEVLDEFAENLSDDFLTYKWKIPRDLEEKTLFTLGDNSYSTKDFAKFLRTNSRSRLRMNNNLPIPEAVDQLFEEFVHNECIKFEEANLEDKYPDFKSLMREYEEGILLFEATKLAVWDKASQDTTGLKAFHEEHQDDYMWDQRAMVAHITLNDVDTKKAGKIYKKAASWDVDKLKKKYNKKGEIVTSHTALFEKNQLSKNTDLEFEVGSMSELTYDDTSQEGSFKKVSKILPPEPKRLNEARGYIIADYQDHLEKEWIQSLRDRYEVKVNDKVFESLVK